MNELLDFFETHKELSALILAAVGGAFALWRWMVDQKWRRVQYAQSLINEFFQEESTSNALKILDVSDEKVDLSISDKKITVEITGEFLIRSLAINFNTDDNDEDTLHVRTILDDFLGNLSNFQSHIEAGLIKLRDIRPYLVYWIRELTGKGRIQTNANFGRQVAAYSRHFGYESLIKLANAMGATFPEGEIHLVTTPPNLSKRAAQVLDAISDFEVCLSNATPDMLASDKVRRMAVERSFEIICRAVSLLPERVKAAQQQIDWQSMTDLRSRLLKFYYCNNIDALLDITRQNLPPLKAFAERTIRAPET